MAALKQCEFFLLRYIPDLVKGEFVNIGAVLLEEGDDGFTDVRFTHDWRRVRCLNPEADLELLASFESEFRRLLQSRVPEIINYRGATSRRDWLMLQMQQSFSGSLEMAPMEGVLTENPAAELGQLARTYLESTARPRPRAQSGRRVIFQAMVDAFERAGVWQVMRKNIAAADYTRKGDPLTIDCGYRPNGVIHLFHALPLAAGVDPVKSLAFSYQNLRIGLNEAEHVASELTVVTEDGLDVNEESIGFALATLQDNDIHIAAASQMPAIAERARIELKL